MINRQSTMIRPFSPADLSAVCEIQRKCPQAGQWREEDYLRLATDEGGTILVAEVANANQREIAGFAAFLCLRDEADLRNLAVDPARQRKGIARALLTAGLGAMQSSGVQKLFLDVRASNQPARALYASLGFHLMYTRRNYYHEPEEDGLVMACEMNRHAEAKGLHGELT